MSEELKKILSNLNSGSIEFGLAIQQVNDVAEKIDQSLADKLEKTIFFSAKEVVHYNEQFKGAETPQWEQSFGYELERSQKDFIKQTKKYLKT